MIIMENNETQPLYRVTWRELRWMPDPCPHGDHEIENQCCVVTTGRFVKVDMEEKFKNMREVEYFIKTGHKFIDYVVESEYNDELQLVKVL